MLPILKEALQFSGVEALRLRGFSDIRLVSPRKGEQGADLTCIKAGIRICIEVKAVTKQSRGRDGFFFEEQLYEKVREHAEKAVRQLGISADLALTVFIALKTFSTAN
jgi:hypothetical protein